MKIEYNNLYTHLDFTTLHRLPLIVDMHRERIEKYITGIMKTNFVYEAFIKFYQKTVNPK
jgi:hypothetical protein